MFLFALGAAEMLTVAIEVRTVYIAIAWRVAVQAARDHLLLARTHGSRDAFIENIATAIEEFALHNGILSIGHDAAVQLRDIGEAFAQQEAGELLTPNAAGAVG